MSTPNQNDYEYYLGFDFIIELLGKASFVFDEETLNDWLVILLIIQSQKNIKLLKLIESFITKDHCRNKLKEHVKYYIKKALAEEREKRAPYSAKNLELTEKQQVILQKLARGSHSPLHFKERATIILLYFFNGMNISQIARELNCVRNTVRKWVNRWLEKAAEINLIEKDYPHRLKSTIEAALEDAYRCGSPGKFTLEQIIQIINLVLHKTPHDIGIPLTHWTVEALAKAAVELNIVDTISTSRVHSLLSELHLKPHKHRMWVNPQIENEEEYNEQVRLVCELYRNADKLEEMGIQLFCTDEMTGIQALKHAHPTHPAGINKAVLIEHQYERKGTRVIIASRNVSSGKITALVQQTRTEKDFEKHIIDVISQDKTKDYIFIVDQLNTHQSESLVLLSAKHSGIDPTTLGVKGKSGVLKSMKTRAEFLSDPQRKLRFVYTPKHCSWLNQIEIWFSIIKRRILNRRASFNSVEELERQIRMFIEHYNQYLAKPFNWTYGGKLLKENEAQIA